MQINGVEVSPATIGHIAEAFKIRHSDECRAQNGKGRKFFCRCDFFQQIAEHLDVPSEEEITKDAAEAKRLLGEGYRQKSRRYRLVARIENGSWGEGIEVPEPVFNELRRLVKEAEAERLAIFMTHFKSVKGLKEGDACEYRVANNRLGADHTPKTDWLPGAVVQNNNLAPWRIKPAESEEIVRARPENIRRPPA